MKKFTLLLAAFVGCFIISANAQVPCPINSDLELGNLSYWQFYAGTCCPITTPSVVTTPSSHFTLTTGAGLDPCGGFPIVGAGIYSLKIGDNSGTSGAQKAVYNVHVPPVATNYGLFYRYAFVYQDAGHTASQQPRMTIQAIDSATGAILPCANGNFIGGSIPGVSASTSCTLTPTYYVPWTTAVLDLSAYAGHTIRFEFATSDCAPGGHFGYGYVDMTCGFYGATNNAGCDSMITLTAPPGFASSVWYDSMTYTVLYGTTGTTTIPYPTYPMGFAVILTPYAGLGCKDTLFTTINPVFCSGTPVAGTVSSTTFAACATSSVTLTNIGYSGTGFQWQSSPDSLTWASIPGATSSTYTATGITVTTYFRCKDSCCSSGLTAVTPGIKITYTTCCSAPAAGLVNTTTATACATYSFTLTDAGYTPGLFYQWQSSPDSLTWSNITGANTTVYTAPGISANTYYRFKDSCFISGLAAVTPGVKITYSPCCSGAPAAGLVNTTAVTACATSPFTLTDAGYTPSLFYQWQSSPDSLTWSNITGANTTVYTAPGISANTYYRFKDSCFISGLAAVTPGMKITYSPCPPGGVPFINTTHKVEIYPNPTTDELTIKMDKDAYNSFTITNNVGQVLIQQQLSTTLTKVNVKMLPVGLYYITVKGDNGSKVQKFVKM